MITRIEFLQDLPIPQMGFATGRWFSAADGWVFELDLSGVQMTRDGRTLTVSGVPFVAHHAARAPLEPEQQPANVDETRKTKTNERKKRA